MPIQPRLEFQSVLQRWIESVQGDGALAFQPIIVKRRGTHGNARVITGATGHKDNSTATTNDIEISTQTAQSDSTRIKIDSTPHGVDHTFGLLMNLLFHKVIIRSFHDGSQFDFQRFNSSNG